SAVEKQCLSNAKDVSRTRLAVSRKILLTEALVPHIACVGPVASRCANVKAVAMSCSAGTTRLISPMRSAAAAVRRSPVSKNSQIHPDLVVKSQPTDIVDIVLQLIRRPNGAHRACHSRKSRGEPFSTSEVQWSTTKSDGVCLFAMEHHRQHWKHRL